MRVRNLLIAAALLLCLSGAVWWANKHPKAATPDAEATASVKVADIPASDVVQLDIAQKAGAAVTLKRENGRWAITAPQPLPADQDAVTAMLSALSPMTADSVVTDNPGDVTQYGLGAPPLTVKVYLKNGRTKTFNFGANLVVGSSAYARIDSDPKVYAVPASAKTSFDKSLADLRDKRLLPFDSAKLATVEVASNKGDVQFAKNASGDWQIVRPQTYRADNLQVDELVRKLGDAKMDASDAAAQQKAAAAYQGEDESGVAVVKVTDNSGQHTLQIRKSGGSYYGHSDAVKGFYKLSSDLGTQLDKPADDYRNKKLFDFAFSDLSRISVEQGGTAKTYTRSGSDWKLGSAKVDVGKVQALIDKLRDLTAASFLKGPMPPVTVSFSVTTEDNKRTEIVALAKTGAGYAAQRSNDPVVYGLDAPTVDDLLKATAEIKNTGK